MNGVDEAGAAAALAGCGFLDHEIRIDELGEMLTDGIVVELEMLRELADVDGGIGVGEVAEDLVTGRIPERPRLLLQRRRESFGVFDGRPCTHLVDYSSGRSKLTK